MEQQIGNCSRCMYFDRYFVKKATTFQSTSIGWCEVKKEIVKSRDSCEECKKRQLRRTSYHALILHLNDLLTEISEVKGILEDVDYESRHLL